MTHNPTDSPRPAQAGGVEPRWTVAVLGPGGVGGLIGALVARAGHRVILLGRPSTVDFIRDRGLSLRSSQFGEFTVSVQADTELRQPVDACVISVKQTALAAALERVRPEALSGGLVVPLLNGIEHPTALRRRYRRDLVAPGVIRVESIRVGPGRIVHGSPFVEVDLASSTAPRPRLEALARMLTGAGIPTDVADDEARMLWSKLFFLAPFALMTTHYRCPIGVIRTRHRGELVALLDELVTLSERCGLPGDTDAALRFYDAFPPDAKSSMQRDAQAGAPLELDAIGGAVLRVAERHAIEVPLIKNLVDNLASRQ